jgi:hypothetical protein
LCPAETGPAPQVACADDSLGTAFVTGCRSDAPELAVVSFSDPLPAGRRTVKTEPPPRAGSAVADPPCASATCRTMASPKSRAWQRSCARRTVEAVEDVLLTVLALLLAGCGSSKSTGAASPAGQGGQPPQLDQQAFERLQQCLQDHGVTLPSRRPQGGQRGQRPTFDAKTQRAFRACSQYLPSRPQGRFGGQGFNGPSA